MIGVVFENRQDENETFERRQIENRGHLRGMECRYFVTAVEAGNGIGCDEPGVDQSHSILNNRPPRP